MSFISLKKDQIPELQSSIDTKNQKLIEREAELQACWDKVDSKEHIKAALHNEIQQL